MIGSRREAESVVLHVEVDNGLNSGRVSGCGINRPGCINRFPTPLYRLKCFAVEDQACGFQGGSHRGTSRPAPDRNCSPCSVRSSPSISSFHQHETDQGVHQFHLGAETESENGEATAA